MTWAAQFDCVFKLGVDAGSLTDYSAQVSEVFINQRRSTVVKAPSFGSTSFEEKAGATGASLSITLDGSPHATAGILAELRAAQATTSGELYFEWRASGAAVSASNPKFTGFIVVSDIDTGGRVGEVRRISKTFPARSVSAPITS
jgi:hypothetical protein